MCSLFPACVRCVVLVSDKADDYSSLQNYGYTFFCLYHFDKYVDNYLYFFAIDGITCKVPNVVSFKHSLHEQQEFELTISAAFSLHLNLQKRYNIILSSFKSQVLHYSEKDSQIQKKV